MPYEVKEKLPSRDRKFHPPTKIHPVKDRTIIFKHIINIRSRNNIETRTIFPLDPSQILLTIHSITRKKIAHNFGNDKVDFFLVLGMWCLTEIPFP